MRGAPVLLALGLVLASATPAPAEPSAAEPSAAEPLEALVDRVVASQLETYRIPGATVALVREGEAPLIRGHGLADAGQARPVEGERTLFRAASVGKLLVWTAVMQLVEQGRLDLDEDVGTYLQDMRLPDTGPPLTLAHLMAHTAGFEVRERLWPQGPPLDSLDAWLRERRPARVRPPGLLSAYSDYGTSLAQHVVEHVSGLPFEQYLQRHVLEPLGMTHTFFRRTVPPERAAHVARGHVLGRDGPRAQSLEEVVVASGGSLLTTAPDMARFMRAHLQGGVLGGQRLLREETVRRMHRQHFTHDARLSGWAHGFMEFHRQGQRLIGHTGDAYLFHSLLVLLPERGLGLFVSYNGLGEKDGAQRARLELLHAVLEHVLAAPSVPPPPASGAITGGAARFVGGYHTTWRAYTTAESSLAWRQELRVREGGAGVLRIQEPGGTPRPWVEVEPLRFRPADAPGAPERAVFRQDAGGRITHLLLENRPTAAYERAAWYATAAFTYGLLATCAVLFTLAVGGALRYRSLALGWVATIGLLHLLFLAGFTLLVRHRSGVGATDVPWLLKAALACALGATVLTPGALGWSVHAWCKRAGGLAPRLLLTGGTLAALAFAAWLRHWHLLGA